MLTMSCASISRQVEQITDEIERGRRPQRPLRSDRPTLPKRFHLKYGRPGRKYARLVPCVDCMAHDIDPYLRKRL
jgi:hypothetical protein